MLLAIQLIADDQWFGIFRYD